MIHLQLFGVILEHIGQELQKPDSRFSKKFLVSQNQFCAMLKIVRILTSPSVQTLYIGDLADHWDKSVSTIKNWMDCGLIRRGHKRVGDTRMFWYASEVEADEERLISYGYITARHNPVHRMIKRVRQFLVFKDC